MEPELTRIFISYKHDAPHGATWEYHVATWKQTARSES